MQVHGYINEKNANNSNLPNTPERHTIGRSINNNSLLSESEVANMPPNEQYLQQSLTERARTARVCGELNQKPCDSQKI